MHILKKPIGFTQHPVGFFRPRFGRKKEPPYGDSPLEPGLTGSYSRVHYGQQLNSCFRNVENVLSYIDPTGDRDSLNVHSRFYQLQSQRSRRKYKR